MLSSQAAADVQDTGGVTVISGDSSVETLYYWLFDQSLNLVGTYELTDEALVNGLWGSVFAAAPDGKALVYAEGPSLYQYTFETQELTEITPAMSATVYFEGGRVQRQRKLSCLFRKPGRAGKYHGLRLD